MISKIASLYRRHKVSNNAPWTWKLHLLVMLWFGFWSWLTLGRHFVMFTQRGENLVILVQPSATLPKKLKFFLSISCLSETELQKLNFEAFWRPHDTQPKPRSQPKPFDVSYWTTCKISPLCSLTLSMCVAYEERFLPNQVKLHDFVRNFPKYTWRASSCRKEWSNNLPVKAPVQMMLLVVK